MPFFPIFLAYNEENVQAAVKLSIPRGLKQPQKFGASSRSAFYWEGDMIIEKYIPQVVLVD